MSLSAKLQQRQVQSLVMTPQLAQSIKLLQLSHTELQEFVNDEIEKNPLLELGSQTEGYEEKRNRDEPTPKKALPAEEEKGLVQDGGIYPQAGYSLENEYDTGIAGAEKQDLHTDKALPEVHLNSSPSNAGDVDFDVLSNIGQAPSFTEFLERQIALEFKQQDARNVAIYISHGLDEDGYFREPLEEVAIRTQTSVDMVKWVLDRFQSFEPAGIGARNLAECLELQLKDKNRFDPAMKALLDHVDLLAKREFSKLRALCEVSKEDFNQMLAEIRALDPRPAKSFDSGQIEAIVPDVLVTQSQAGDWHIELNPETLPKVLINQEYHLELTQLLDDPEGKTFVSDCMEKANWLTRSLDQRAHTILKVAAEIVKKQDKFFAEGVQHLKPLTLKQVAEKIKMHESTVSRVTANKYLLCDQGTFELKYFFSTAIPSKDGESAVSAEAVKHHIQKMVNTEDPRKILSDEQIVNNLQECGIAIARRTVAKYREALQIPSSVERRRQKSSST
ncbi:MAG: RNA polymerase factor sigma-54 [Pseudomonadota bacterium]